MSVMTLIRVFLTIGLATASPTPVKARDDSSLDPAGYVEPSQIALPEPTTPTVGTDGASSFQWQIWGKCDDKSKNAVTKAWEDSKKFSDALAKWKPKADFQPAMDTYMGTRSTYSDLFGYDYPVQIQNTIKRHQGLYDGKSSSRNAKLWVYCNEDSYWWKHCAQTATSAVIAYEQEAAVTNNWYITFCPAFYSDNYQLDFDIKVAEIASEPKQIMEVYDGPPGFQAATFFHETMHMSQLVTSPQAGDSAYGPKKVYDLARSRNTDAAVYNADSWTMAAQAIWAQTTYNLPDPPLPRDYIKQSDAAAAAWQANSSAMASTSIAYVDFEAVVPQGASSVAEGGDYFVDPTLWQIYIPGKGLTDLVPPGGGPTRNLQLDRNSTGTLQELANNSTSLAANVTRPERPVDVFASINSNSTGLLRVANATNTSLLLNDATSAHASKPLFSLPSVPPASIACGGQQNARPDNITMISRREHGTKTPGHSKGSKGQRKEEQSNTCEMMTVREN